MKTILTTLFFIAFMLFFVNAQDGHYWQNGTGLPKILPNSDNSKLAVLTYDRLTIFDLKNGQPLTTHNFVYNNGPLFDQGTRISSNTDDFNFLTIQNTKGSWWHLNTYKNSFDKLNYNKTHFIYGLDYKNRVIAYDYKSKEVYIQENGENKIIDTIDKPADIYIFPQGRTAYYLKGKRLYYYNFTTDTTEKFPKNANFSTGNTVHSSMPNWIFYKMGHNIVQHNILTDDEELIPESNQKKFFPKPYHKCIKNLVQSKRALGNGKFFYALQVDTTLTMSAPETIKEKPYMVVQYNTETCQKEQDIHFSMDTEAFLAKQSQIIADLEAKKVEEEAKKSQAALDAKKAEQDIKEFFMNFSQLSTNNEIDMGSVQGRNISNLALTKKLLGNVNGQVHAIGWIKDCYGESKLLLIAINSNNNTDFRILRISNKGQNWGHKHIVSVPIVNGKIGAYTSISFQEFGNLFYVKYTKKDIRTNKTTSNKIEAHCGGKWN